MHIEYIEDFIKVAEYQSINKACTSLNISAPALSKRIMSMEAHLKTELFYRTPQGMFLTENGKLVLEEFKKINKGFVKLKSDIANYDNSNLKVGVLPSFYYNKFKGNDIFKIKDISIKIESNTQKLFELLGRGELDAIIGDIDAVQVQKLESKIIYQEKYMVVFHKSCSNLLKNIRGMSSLENKKIFLLNSPCDTEAFFKRNLDEYKMNIEHKSDLESIVANIKNNGGLTIIPESLISRVLDSDIGVKQFRHYAKSAALMAYNKGNFNKVERIVTNMCIK